jgi:hypothetical protein
MNMPAHQDGIRGNHVISNQAIVGNMRASHEEIMATNLSHSILFFRGAIHCHRFTKDVVISNLHFSFTSAVTHILRWSSDDDSRKQLIEFAQSRVPHQGDLAFQSSASSDANIRANDTKRSNKDIFRYFSSRIDSGARVNMCSHGVSSVKSTTLVVQVIYK